MLLDAYLSEFSHRDSSQLYILTRPFQGGKNLQGGSRVQVFRGIRTCRVGPWSRVSGGREPAGWVHGPGFQGDKNLQGGSVVQVFRGVRTCRVGPGGVGSRASALLWEGRFSGEGGRAEA